MEVLTSLIVESFHNYTMCQVIVLYTVNLYNIICQLYLNEAGKKNPNIKKKDCANLGLVASGGRSAPLSVFKQTGQLQGKRSGG